MPLLGLTAVAVGVLYQPREVLTYARLSDHGYAGSADPSGVTKAGIIGVVAGAPGANSR
jgi:hypothetical protein